MKNPPAFQFYPADYLADMNVRLLSWASKGLYMDLLCYCWREGYIPSDSSAIAMLCGCHDLAIVEPCLKLFATHPDDPSKLVHLRLIAEREKQIAFSNSKSEAGKLGAQVKWNKRKSTKGGKAMAKDSSAIISPLAKNSSTSSSSSPTSLVLSKDNTPSDAEEIYAIYPLKVGRKKAIEAIRKALKKASKETLLESVQAFAAARNGVKEFTPHASTWFNEERWVDDRETWKPRSNASTGARQPSTHATRSGYAEQEELEIPDA